MFGGSRKLWVGCWEGSIWQFLVCSFAPFLTPHGGVNAPTPTPFYPSNPSPTSPKPGSGARGRARARVPGPGSRGPGPGPVGPAPGPGPEPLAPPSRKSSLEIGLVGSIMFFFTAYYTALFGELASGSMLESGWCDVRHTDQAGKFVQASGSRKFVQASERPAQPHGSKLPPWATRMKNIERPRAREPESGPWVRG